MVHTTIKHLISRLEEAGAKPKNTLLLNVPYCLAALKEDCVDQFGKSSKITELVGSANDLAEKSKVESDRFDCSVWAGDNAEEILNTLKEVESKL